MIFQSNSNSTRSIFGGGERERKRERALPQHLRLLLAKERAEFLNSPDCNDSKYVGVLYQMEYDMQFILNYNL